jgi:spore germination protein YaaH
LTLLALTAGGLLVVFLEPPQSDPAKIVGSSESSKPASSLTVQGIAERSQPLFYEYRVQPQETIGAIAARFGVSARSIVTSNPGLIHEDGIAAGTVLRVPTIDGTLHVVGHGQSLRDVAAQYGVMPERIARFSGNEIRDPDDLEPGSTILVPR